MVDGSTALHSGPSHTINTIWGAARPLAGGVTVSTRPTRLNGRPTRVKQGGQSKCRSIG
jgi:hypothetical protein